MTGRGVAGVLCGHPGRLLVAAVFTTLAELAGVSLVAVAAWMIVRAAGQPPLAALLVASVAVRAFALSRGVLRYGGRLAGHGAVLRGLAELRERIFGTLAGRDVPAFRAGDAVARLVSDVDEVQDLVLRCLLPAVTAAVVALLWWVFVVLTVPGAALVVAAGLLLTGLVLPLVGRWTTRARAGRLGSLRADLACHTIDLAEGLAELEAVGVAQEAVHRAAGIAFEIAREERRTAWLVRGCGAVGFLVSAGTALQVLLSVPGTPAPLLAALVLGTLAVMEILLPLGEAAERWANASAAVPRVADLVRDIAHTPARGRGEAGADLRLAEVRLRYPGQVRDALSGLSLEIRRGRRIAVVGPSGSGKSSLLALLAGLVPPTEGRVLAGSAEIAALPETDRAGIVRGVLADPHLFHTTLRRNVVLGAENVGDDELDRAADQAGLLGWVRSLPRGWDTEVGSGGTRLSGGQRARVALARALLRPSPVLVLDEPVEGLEPELADEVLGRVLAQDGLTVVLATHRLAALPLVDEILVLENGMLVQQGGHEQLVGRPGYYRDRWAAEQLAEAARMR